MAAPADVTQYRDRLTAQAAAPTPGDALPTAAEVIEPGPPATISTERVQAIFAASQSNTGTWPDVIETAFTVARDAHEGQFRRSGEPYITHPIAVAEIVAGLGVDGASVVAALLHDVVEDTPLTLDDVTAAFGAEVASLVDGLTKLDGMHFDSVEAAQAAQLRKMLVSLAKDLRVIVVKLADRLHNMRTLGALPPGKGDRIARETLDVYAPLAHRLGLYDLRCELEDLAFATLHPARHNELVSLITARAPRTAEYLERCISDVQDCLTESGVAGEVTGRHKHLWSLHRKMTSQAKTFDEIYDFFGLRIVVGEVKDCYAALGAVHSLFSPVPGRFKDMIAVPKFNLYQSLHATVVGPGGRPLEVQIRTVDMHERAEQGIAAHWSYKEGAQTPSAGEMEWLGRLLEWNAAEDSAEFMAGVRGDLEVDEVFVFTPQGRVITLPSGATPIDFAYAVHTEVGHSCIGARVNDRIASLRTRLSSGDRVEILTSNAHDAGPSRDWLAAVVTSRARGRIRQWFAREQRDDQIAAGMDVITQALRAAKLPSSKAVVARWAKEHSSSLGYDDLDGLCIAIAGGHANAATIVERITGEMPAPAPPRPPRTATPGDGPALLVDGDPDVDARLAGCCAPSHGDPIVGFVTKARGVSVHHRTCTNTAWLTRSPDRCVNVTWAGPPAPVRVAIEVEALDRPRLLAEVTSVLADLGVNILACTTETGADAMAQQRFDFLMADAGHLDAVLEAVRGIDHVYDVNVIPAT